jgi:hypothetical protein
VTFPYISLTFSTHLIAVLSWSSVLEYIRNLQKPTSRQKNVEECCLESGVENREIQTASVAEKIEIIFDEMEYIDEDSSEIQLQVKNGSTE